MKNLLDFLCHKRSVKYSPVTVWLFQAVQHQRSFYSSEYSSCRLPAKCYAKQEWNESHNFLLQATDFQVTLCMVVCSAWWLGWTVNSGVKELFSTILCWVHRSCVKKIIVWKWKLLFFFHYTGGHLGHQSKSLWPGLPAATPASPALPWPLSSCYSSHWTAGVLAASTVWGVHDAPTQVCLCIYLCSCSA